MPFRIDNLIVLLGLFALAIPVVLHLLQRRRHDILDWGAMQFLPESITTQRRRWLDEILLMLLRMAIVTLIVLALATPISTSPWLGFLGDRSTRDTVLVLDGSYSMEVRVPGQKTPWDDALRQAHTMAGQAGRGESFTILLARQPPHFVGDELDIAHPRANPGMPRALAEAWKHLQTRSHAATKEIVVLTDGQRHGWADLATLSALDDLGQTWHADADKARTDGVAIPSLRVIKVGAVLPPKLPNFALAPLVPARGVAKVGQRVTFQSALQLHDFATYQRPRSVKVFVDNQEIERLSLPENIDLKKGQIPLTFAHRFEREGQSVVSLVLDADDALAADNEQHVVMDIVKELPVLVVDGDATLSPESSSFFLQRALSAQKALPYHQLKSTDLGKPAVLVLADVPRLDAKQLEAIDNFLEAGGGLLVVAGERVSKATAFYNDQLHRQGKGWLPARLGDVGVSKNGLQPEARKFQHPALELFRAAPDSLKDVRFPKWSKAQLGAGDRATVIATLSNGDPMLIEKTYKNGRVLLCTVPLDRRWDANLPSAWEFPVLVNELAYYLAGSRNVATTLRQGEAIRLPAVDLGPRLTLLTPEIRDKVLDVKSSPWVYDNTGVLGVYRVTGAQRAWSFVVPPDLRESDLTRANDDDWANVRERLKIAWRDEQSEASITGQDRHREELWWLLLLAVVGLLCGEVWMTRRMALGRAG